ESTFDLHTAEGAIVEKPAILPCKRHSLGDALVNDVSADLSQPVDVGFTGTKIAALHGILEKTKHTVTVVAIVLCGVNPALRCDGMCAPWSVVIGEAVDVITLLTESSGGRRPSQSRTHDDDRVFAAIGGIDQLHLEAALVPLLLDWT